MLTNELSTIFVCLYPLLERKTYRQLLLVTQALLAMTGRITMLGISRWAGIGGSYRTIQRFFRSKIPWESLNWAIAKTFVFMKPAEGEVVIAGDATTVLKSGKETFGLGSFFSSLYSRAVAGLGFQTLSLLDSSQGKSWPILVEQIQPKPKGGDALFMEIKWITITYPRSTLNQNRPTKTFVPASIRCR